MHVEASLGLENPLPLEYNGHVGREDGVASLNSDQRSLCTRGSEIVCRVTVHALASGPRRVLVTEAVMGYLFKTCVNGQTLIACCLSAR